ncbi:MAG TPA: hypothetical protein VF148_04365 [Acidimicrobiia bacterium]
MSNEFVRAEHKYRGEVLRDQYQSEPTGKVGKVVAVLVVAGALLLAACGTPTDTDPGADQPSDSTVVQSQDQESSGAVQVLPAREEMTSEEEFSGIPAPDWHPTYGRLPLAKSSKRETGPR